MTTYSLNDKKIALIGAGRMGTGMGLCLLRHGAKLYVKTNNNRKGIDRLIENGAIQTPTIPALTANAQTIILSLPSSLEVEAVCLGPDGLFAHLPAGSLIIDTTTANPKSTLALYNEAKKRGIAFVDAPVTRSPEHAEQGKLNAIVGAKETIYPQVRNILSAFCETVTHVGEVGSGHKMKLIYNGMTMGLAAVSAEICQLAERLDVDLDTLRSIVARGSTNSGIFQKFAAFMLGEEPDALSISIANAAKDIAGTLALAEDVQTPVPVLAAASEKLESAKAGGNEALTLPHLAKTHYIIG